jgi:hypothetical protein
MPELPGPPGFAPPRPAKKLARRQTAALELIATIALTVSLIVAATAVSMGNKSFARGSLFERQTVHMPVARE